MAGNCDIRGGFQLTYLSVELFSPVARCFFNPSLLCFRTMTGVPGKAAIDRKTGKFQRFDYVKITIWGLALSALWGSLHSIILPMRLLDFVAESEKNTYLGLLTLSGLLLAMAVQPVAGAISDRSIFTWGRRRPYILIGTLVAVLLIPGIGLAGSYTAIFITYCLLQVSTNIAQGPFQAFIPDLVPGNKRGLASGVKCLLEIIGGFGLVYLIVQAGNYFTSEGNPWLWLVLGLQAAFLLALAYTAPMARIKVSERLTEILRLRVITKIRSGKIACSHLGPSKTEIISGAATNIKTLKGNNIKFTKPIAVR